MQDFVFIMRLCVKDEAVEELKKVVDHNIEALMNLDGWPEITEIWDAQLVKPEDVRIDKLREIKED